MNGFYIENLVYYIGFIVYCGLCYYIPKYFFGSVKLAPFVFLAPLMAFPLLITMFLLIWVNVSTLTFFKCPIGCVSFVDKDGVSRCDCI